MRHSNAFIHNQKKMHMTQMVIEPTLTLEVKSLINRNRDVLRILEVFVNIKQASHTICTCTQGLI